MWHAMDSETAQRRVRVWDLPTRLFHWALVALLVISYVTAQLDELDWHMRSGECILALLLFRLLWGLFGSDTARFATFLRGPRAVWRALRGAGPDTALGHNAAGGWAVAAMLLFLCAQVGTGLFADDDISEQGPLAQFVERPARKFLTGLHDRNVNILLGLAALHVSAIGFYWAVRRKNLVWPMIVGTKWVPSFVDAPRMRGLAVAVGVFAFAAAVAMWVASFQS
jgi:cytochrome b